MKNLDDWLTFAQVRQSIETDTSSPNLLHCYELVNAKNPELPHLKKLLAEICFLLATEYKSKKPEQSIYFAQKSIQIYRELNIQTIEEAEPVLTDLLPELMHEDVVRSRIMGNL